MTPPGRPAPALRRKLTALGIGCVLAAVLAAVLFTGRGGPATSAAVATSAPGIGPAAAALLGLNVVPAPAAPPAPGFDLTDQYGRPFSLSSLRGKVVVWSLNDDRCTDLCSLYSSDVLAADRDLGPAARDVFFVAVNANPYYPDPGSLRAWDERNLLAGVANWVYVTGSPDQLKAVWSAYHVTVLADPTTRTVSHDAVLEFIDPAGAARAYGLFDKGAISTGYYAHAMAQMADDLLPAADRVKVGGPSLPDHPGAAPAVGGTAPAFALNGLGGGPVQALATLDHQPLVLNFWSSTCAPCTAEMPQLQKVASDFTGRAAVVGVDVADPRGAAAAFAARLGAHYPLLADPQGATAASYRVTALPVTFLVAPGGSIVARHDGPLTASELEAVLQEDFPQLQ